ncbi:MAG: hypothetical protein IAC29_00090 [Bacteroidetes bacterium]|uniref:Major fimbrial subunit protein N-terminal domain-containing protein n=1 Tax=Candidatus Cryptobacteroides merdigallinarum TaxID=2840770 RepID=A0A9D9EM26_9BACT|nr:hypothetical protein [Candidatus Cryptobacteroides merdigallinarum]
MDMTIRLHAILSMLLLAALTACDRDDRSVSAPAEGELRISTKSRRESTGAADGYEDAVNGLQVLVFSADGMLETYGETDSPKEGLCLTGTAGEKTVWAAANAPDLSGIGHLSDLKSATVRLDGNSTDPARGLAMSGCSTCSVTPGRSGEINIPVERLLSRITLDAITCRLPQAYGSLTVESVMLINVAGDTDITGTSGPAAWCNRMGRSSGSPSGIIDGQSFPADCPEMTFRKIGKTMAPDETVGYEIPLYCLPNPAEEDREGGSSFTPRKTRLVVTATLGGTRYYYPVTIDRPERNTSYSVSMTITGPGSTDPDRPISKQALSFSISVSPWGDGGSYDERI